MRVKTQNAKKNLFASAAISSRSAQRVVPAAICHQTTKEAVLAREPSVAMINAIMMYDEKLGLPCFKLRGMDTRFKLPA